MIAEFLRITGGEEHFVHVDEFGGCQSSIRTVLLKTKEMTKLNEVLISIFSDLWIPKNYLK